MATKGHSPAVIVSAVRTPIGAFNGALSSLPATQLGAIAIREAVQRAGVPADAVDEVIMGQVLTAGAGQAPARQAALGAGLPNSTRALTINKVCGSGLKAVMLAADAVRLGHAKIVVAGGMESMSNAPYLLPNARTGYRLGNGELVDSMIRDGLWDVYNDYHMGNAGELCASTHHFSREDQDAYAISSFQRALDAQKNGRFDDELVPVTLKTRKGEVVVREDESPQKVNFDKLPTLKPVFKPDGTITPANASSLNDGASAVVVMRADTAKEMGLTPLATITAYTSAAAEPEWFTTAPVACIEKLMTKTQSSVDDIDLFEVNEAFAVVNLYAEKASKLDRNKVNVHGGAIALGHPIGASGARILTTLLYAMKHHQKKTGLASLCIGGGEAAGMMVSR